MNAIILAGGKSSRFGSNKALYKINQKPMLVNIVEKLSPIFKKIYIIGDQKDKYEEIRGTVYLRDKIPDKGPLGGLYTGLS
ncbi:MAG TPA: NTP transferase domain-containing protein, partial [Halanaerobiales bacterium]|nr:NTP transferase domain-containing protein [Halanaerobiales bacterium]